MKPGAWLRGFAARTAALGLLALAMGTASEAKSIVATAVAGAAGDGGYPFDKANQRKIVRDASDAVYVVFTRWNTTNSRREVVITRCTSDCGNTGTWATPAVLFSSASADFLYPSIDVSDDRSTLHVVAFADATKSVLYTRNSNLPGTGWSTLENWTKANGDASGPGVDYDTIVCNTCSGRSLNTNSGAASVAVDPLGRPHVAYVSQDASLRPNVFYNYFDGAWVYADPGRNLSGITTSGLAQNLDPSIDIASGYLHVLYRDSPSAGDPVRYSYVRNVTPGNFNSGGFTSPVSIIERNPGVACRPGSLAAYGKNVWVTGGYNPSPSTDYGWQNTSTDAGATWVSGTGLGSGYLFEVSAQAYTYVVGLNPAGSDHRALTMHVPTQQFLRRYIWNGTKFNDQGYEADNGTSYSSKEGSHISIEKHKVATSNYIVYCWYKGSGTDRLYCNVDAGMAQAPRFYIRSIGGATTTAPYKEPYTGGFVTVTQNSRTVTGSGTTWMNTNRGRGDVLIVGANTYVIASVDSNTSLTLTENAVANYGPSTSFTIARQFARLQDWEDCISYKTPTSCTYFPVGSENLVADNRAEIGVAYEDVPFKHSTGGTGGATLLTGSPVLSIDGSITDATHTITLTSDGTNRHYGIPYGTAGSANVLIENDDPGPGPSLGSVFLFDDHVTLEWMEVKGGTDATAHGVVIGSPPPTTTNSPSATTSSTTWGATGWTLPATVTSTCA